MRDNSRHIPAETGGQNLPTRRRFLSWGWVVGLGAVLGAQLWLFVKFFRAPLTSSWSPGPVTVGSSQQFAVGSVSHFWQDRFLLVRHATGFRALSHACTHQQCNIDYVPERGVIVCPCHGAQFDLTGAVLTGPATRPLTRFATAVRDGQVIVDTSQRL